MKKPQKKDQDIDADAATDGVNVDTQADAVSSVEPKETAVTIDPHEEVTRLHGEIAELNDKLLRLRAEYENFRRRTFKDIATARSTAVSDTALPFINIFDNVAMAIVSAVNSDNLDAIRQGLQMIMGEYVRTIGDIGISKFDAVGAKFDPAIHDAVAHEPSAEVEEGTVLKQWTCGYKLGEKLLRPARVVVSAGPEKK